MSKRTLLVTALAAPAIALTLLPAGAQDVVPERPAELAETEAMPIDFRSDRRARHGRGLRFQRLLRQADADGNGSVTQDEVDAFLAAQLTRADDDGDGAVALDEFETIFMEQARPRMVDAFQDLDEDGDGRITSGEVGERFGSIVERFDRNGDGALGPDDRRRRDRGRHHRRDRRG